MSSWRIASSGCSRSLRKSFFTCSRSGTPRGVGGYARRDDLGHRRIVVGREVRGRGLLHCPRVATPARSGRETFVGGLPPRARGRGSVEGGGGVGGPVPARRGPTVRRGAVRV